MDIEAVNRAVETVSVMAGFTRVKQALADDRGALSNLAAAAAWICVQLDVADAVLRSHDADIKWPLDAGRLMVAAAECRPVLYGLAYILSSCTASRSRQLHSKLVEMGVSVSQYEGLQRLLAPGALPGESDGTGARGDLASLDEDPPTQVEARLRKLLAADMLPVLAVLAEAAPLALPPSAAGSTGKGGRVAREVLSSALANVSEHAWARGTMLTAGLLPTLITLALDRDHNTVVGNHAATQSLARILITTHPSLVPPTHLLDAITPLLTTLRDSTEQLQLFEALMALTNVLSTGEEARSRCLALHGASALESCQFSDHKLVARAATEALCNLATTPSVRRLITHSRLNLWVALARGALVVLGDEDAHDARSGTGEDAATERATGMAACGGLAMAFAALVAEADEGDEAAVKELSGAVDGFVNHGGISALVAPMLMSDDVACVHRAAFLADQVAHTPRGCAALLSPALPADERGAPAPDAALPLASTPTMLLLLLAEGKVPATLFAGRRAAAAPPPVQAVATSASRRVLSAMASARHREALLAAAHASGGAPAAGAGSDPAPHSVGGPEGDSGDVVERVSLSPRLLPEDACRRLLDSLGAPDGADRI